MYWRPNFTSTACLNKVETTNRCEALKAKSTSLFQLKYEEIQSIFIGKSKKKPFESSQMENFDSDLQYINHPIHILTKDNAMSPSSFIPLCEFGGRMDSMGVRCQDNQV